MKLAIRLHPSDSVAVAMEAGAPGECFSVLSEQGAECDRVEIASALPLPYHKVALAEIAAGEAVLKYGQVIGLASAPIRRGEWVHLHNLQSATFGPRGEEA